MNTGHPSDSSCHSYSKTQPVASCTSHLPRVAAFGIQQSEGTDGSCCPSFKERANYMDSVAGSPAVEEPHFDLSSISQHENFAHLPLVFSSSRWSLASVCPMGLLILPLKQLSYLAGRMHFARPCHYACEDEIEDEGQ